MSLRRLTFAALVAEAKNQFARRPTDLLRFVATERAEGGFDLEKFFRRSVWDVHASDMWRWRALCVAVEEMRVA